MMRIRLMKPFVGKEELNKIKEVLDSGFLTEGKYTEEFEKKFAKYVEAKHAIATTSCTTALELCLRALEIGKGDEVIVPDFTYPATAQVVYLVGAKPVLVDVDLRSYNVTARNIKKAINEKTRAIIPVSLFGNPLDEEVYELKDKYDIYIIEDAACSAGAMLNGKKIGTQADLTCFSFHPRKIITTGEGGMITTNNEELAEKIRALKRFGIVYENGKPVFKYIGTNYKLPNILAAIGLVQLEKIEDIIKDRIKKAKYYMELLSEIDWIIPPEVRPNTRHTFQSFCCYVKNGKRDELRRKLFEKGIETQIGTYCLHLEPCFKSAGRMEDLNNSKKLYNNLITLPLYYGLLPKYQEIICNFLKI